MMREPGHDDFMQPIAGGISATWWPHMRRPRAGALHQIRPAGWVASPAVATSKDDLPVFSLACFADHHRKLSGLQLVTGAVLDLDHLGAMTVRDLDKRIGAAVGDDVARTAYTTWSSTSADLCARVVHPVSRPLTPAEWPAFWRALAEAYAGAGLALDPKTKDAGHGFYVPAVRLDAVDAYAHCTTVGAPLDVESWLAVIPPAPPRVPRIVSPRSGQRYTDAAVRGELDAVASTGKGGRNGRLFEASCRLIELGALDAAEPALVAAAQTAGLTAGEARKTIDSAIRHKRGAA